LFDIFSQLPKTSWFRAPTTELHSVPVCRQSGQRMGEWCTVADTVSVPSKALETSACAFHTRVHLTKDARFRINSQCANLDELTSTSWFVLPPVQEYYFKSKNITYASLPPLKPGCGSQATTSMDLIYPKAGAKIFVPRDLDGKPGAALFELAHQNAATEVFWHLDEEFIGQTRKIHAMALNPAPGKHKLVLVDAQGVTLERLFEVVEKM